MPRRPAVGEFTGTSLRSATLELILGALDGIRQERSIAHELDELRVMCPVHKTTDPPPVRVHGAWPIPSSATWVVQSMTPGERMIRADGRVIRTVMSLDLLERRVAKVVVKSSPAERAREESGDRKNQRTHRVRSGETLSSIAVRYLGEASRWTEVARLNGIRDPNRLQVGVVLKIPDR